MIINAQDEFNVHNSFGFAADHIFIIGVIMYGFVMPILANQSQFLHRLFDLTGLPFTSLGLAVGFALASVLHDWSFYQALPITPLRVAKTRELLCALGFVILMIEAMSPQLSIKVENKNHPAI